MHDGAVGGGHWPYAVGDNARAEILGGGGRREACCQQQQYSRSRFHRYWSFENRLRNQFHRAALGFLSVLLYGVAVRVGDRFTSSLGDG